MPGSKIQTPGKGKGTQAHATLARAQSRDRGLWPSHQLLLSSNSPSGTPELGWGQYIYIYNPRPCLVCLRWVWKGSLRSLRALRKPRCDPGQKCFVKHTYGGSVTACSRHALGLAGTDSSEYCRPGGHVVAHSVLF